MGSVGMALSAEDRERRRLLAAALLRSGWKQVDVADELGVTEGAVSQWAKVVREQGVQGLVRKAHPGRPSRLNAAQWKELSAILRQGALQAGFPTERWTLRRVAAVIERRWHVRYHPNSLGLLLHRLGFSPQRPRVRAKERDEELIRAWLRRDWPHIKRGLEKAGGRLPSWTRQVTRFGPAWEPPGLPSA